MLSSSQTTVSSVSVQENPFDHGEIGALELLFTECSNGSHGVGDNEISSPSVRELVSDSNVTTPSRASQGSSHVTSLDGCIFTYLQFWYSFTHRLTGN